MINNIFRTSAAIQDNRTLLDVLSYTMSEVGELATEVCIETKFSSKQRGSDGIVGEAVDCIICLVDLIKLYDPLITEEQLMKVVCSKLTKWIDTKQNFIV